MAEVSRDWIRARRGWLGLDLLTTDELTALVLAADPVDGVRVIANHNLHSLALAAAGRMGSFYRSAWVVHADGMGAVAWMRMAGLPVRPGHRTTYADWLPALLARAAGRRIAVVGGSPAAAGRIAGTMAQRHPDLPFLIHHGFFAMDPGSEESRERIADLRSFRPDWLFLAMGMPRQEAWLQAVHAHLPPCLVFQAGAAFDYYAGIVPTPPRFLGRIGLEWAFRLAREPRRLAHRYLVEPFRLAGPLLGLRLRGRTRLLRRAGPGRGSTETAGTGSARP